MKTYRKNRTQCAKLFSVNGISMLGFLVGEQDNKQTFETLKGERVNVSTIKNSEGKTEDVGDEIVEITLTHKTVTNTKTGIITTTPFGNIINKMNSVGGKVRSTPKDFMHKQINNFDKNKIGHTIFTLDDSGNILSIEPIGDMILSNILNKKNVVE